MKHLDTKSAIKAWMAERNCSIEAADIGDDTRIIEQKVITSMQIMDLILFIESLRGKPVEPAQIKAGSFQSVNAIEEAFFTD